MGNSKTKEKNADDKILAQKIKDRELQAKLMLEELERKSKDLEEIGKFRHRLDVYLIEINSPMRLDEYIKLNEYYQHIEMFDEFQPAKAYYVVPIASMTTRLYNAAKQLNQIFGIKFFSKSAKNVCKYGMELYDTHYIVLKITKPILDKLLEPEDISKELELLAKFTSNREFTSTPAKELTRRNVKVDRADALYSWTDFENTFKLKFKPHGFLIYKVRKNKIVDDLVDLHEAYLYYYSDDDQYGWLCYPEKDAKKIASLENLDEEEQTKVLAEMLGVQLDPEFTAVAELPNPNQEADDKTLEQEGRPAEQECDGKDPEQECDGKDPEQECDGKDPEQEGQPNEMITAVADWPKPPERMASQEGEEGQQKIQLN